MGQVLGEIGSQRGPGDGLASSRPGARRKPGVKPATLAAVHRPAAATVIGRAAIGAAAASRGHSGNSTKVRFIWSCSAFSAPFSRLMSSSRRYLIREDKRTGQDICPFVPSPRERTGQDRGLGVPVLCPLGQPCRVASVVSHMACSPSISRM